MKDSVSHEEANRLRGKQDSFSQKVWNYKKIVRDQGNTNLLCEQERIKGNRGHPT